MQVVLISGKAQHGKDTTAGFLKTALEADGYSVLISHYGDLVKYVCEKYFGWNGEKDEYGRSLLQHVGTDVVRSSDEDFWVRFIGEILKFFHGEWDYVLIPDCRFPNEVSYLSSIGIPSVHIRVVRSNFVSPLTPEQQNHLSETALDGCRADTYIQNDGTLEDLRGAVCQWVTDFNGHHQMTFEEIIN